MRIAAFHPFLDRRRGAELAFVAMMAGLQARRHVVQVFTLDVSEDLRSLLSKSNISVESMEAPDAAPTAWHSAARGLGADRIHFGEAVRRAARAMEATRPDLRIVHHARLADLLLPRLRAPRLWYCPELPRELYDRQARRAAQTANLRHAKTKPPPRAAASLIRMFAFGAGSVIARPWWRARYRAGVAHSEAVLANSAFTAANVRRWLGREATVCYPPVDCGSFTPGTGSRSGEVVSIGPLWPPLKGHELVIQAVGRIPKPHRPPVRILGGGTPWERHELEDQARRANVQLSFIPPVSFTELTKIYRSAGAVAIAYLNEPFGLVAAEALACEAAVVAVDEGGLREVLGPSGGWLVPRDPDPFAEAILEAFDDPADARARGSRGRARVCSMFSPDATLDVLERAAQALIA